MENIVCLAGGSDICAIIESYKQLFNEACGSNFFHDDNLKAAILQPERGIADYEKFCKQYFPNYFSKKSG